MTTAFGLTPSWSQVGHRLVTDSPEQAIIRQSEPDARVAEPLISTTGITVPGPARRGPSTDALRSVAFERAVSLAMGQWFMSNSWPTPEQVLAALPHPA